SITARLTSSSVTVILFFSPISESTRPSRTRRSAMVRYSSFAASSVVSSSAKVLPLDSISALIEFHISLNSSSTSDGGASDRKSTRLNSSHTEIYTLSLHDALPISVVSSSAKVLPLDSISALIEFHISLNSSSTSDGGASNLSLSSSGSTTSGC